VPADADDQAVRRAYRAQQRATHPDTTGVDSHVQYDLVTEAGATLTDPTKRAAYDAELAAAETAEPVPGPDPEPTAPDPADDGWGVWGEEVPVAAPVIDEAPPSGLAAPETVRDYARRGGIRAAIVGGPVLLAVFLLAWAGRSAPSAPLVAPLVAAAVLAVWAAWRRVSAAARRVAIVTVVALVACAWWRQGAPDSFPAAAALAACSLVPLAPFVARYYLEEVAP
jgi:hypothetical protein